ncbi:MAG: 3-phosphoshikimate 1-carboxyvinyltransferase [Gammaproteobacteria bacterium]
MSETIFHVRPGGALRGRLRVPGDKSISHRAIMLGSLADGVTEISGFLQGDDCLATLRAFQAMGVQIDGPNDRPGNAPDANTVVIHGVGIDGLQAPKQPLDMGNAGTSMRLLSGLLAGQRFDSVLTGDASLSKRPMRRVTEPLGLMGARLATTAQGTAPIQISGGQALHGIEYHLPMASAQVKSCLLLAGLYASGTTCITEPAPTRDHTERMLSGFGYPVQHHGATVSLQGGGRLQAGKIDVPADISSAAFFLVGASIAPDSDLILEHVGMNPTRAGVIEILRQMGADLELLDQRLAGGEPVADIRVRYAPLHGIHIAPELVPLAIDEFPALFIAAACAEGTTVLSGAEELRAKESDRIQVMADGLSALGISAEPTADGIVIQGGQMNGNVDIQSHHDHRISMSFSMAALRAKSELRIHDCQFVNTSFPGFVTLAAAAGLQIDSHTL